MLSSEDCRSRADQFLTQMSQQWADELTLLPEALETSYTLAFFYQTDRYLITGNAADALAGNAPILINKLTGAAEFAGTARPIEEYIRGFEIKAGHI